LDRVVNLATGLGMIAYAFLGDHDAVWIRGALAALGLVFVIGGIGGT
jgi:hypothetical protein